jgi:predicted phosphodiesterase
LRYGIVSDIHSNLDALEACIAELDGVGMDQLVCLGDVVGYGPNPNECCDLLQARGCLGIAGNHDEADLASDAAERFNPLAVQAIAWTRDQLTEKSRAYLAGLPRERDFPSFEIVHGAPETHFDYILGVTDARSAFERVHKPLTFIGHTHVAEVYFQDEQRKRTFHQRLSRGGRIEIAPQFRYIVNPGSVGQPRDRNPQASFAWFDDGQRVVEIRRVTYDVMRVRERMERAQLPPELAERLSLGY